MWNKGQFEKEEVSGIGGFLILIASWLVILPLSAISTISNLSQTRLALALMGNRDIPSAFFKVSRYGYLLLLPISIYILYAFFKKRKNFLKLEIGNFFMRVLFLGSLCYIMEDVNIIFTELADILALSVLFSFIIIIYFIFSKRVKNTFIE